MRIPKEINTLQNLVNGFLVGGAVRDILRGEQPSDFDIATPLTPDEVMRVLRENRFPVIPVGIQFGTVATLVDGWEVEITTFRREVYLQELGRKPIVSFTDRLEEDLSRRDFTINALAMDGEGKVIDLFGGVEDLERGLIKFVGNPDERINEDPLRMVRFCRFVGRFGDFDVSSFEAVRRNARLIERVSGERVMDEFRKASKAGVMARFWDMMVKTGLASVLFGDWIDKMTEMRHDGRGHHHSETIHEHTVEVLERLSKHRDFVLDMAGITHDWGKVFTLTQKDGKVFFPGHEKVSVELAREGLKRLRFPTKVTKQVLRLVGEHMRVNGLANDKMVARFVAEMRMDKVEEDVLDRMLKLSEADGNADLGWVREKFKVAMEVQMPRGDRFKHLKGAEIRNAIKSELVQKILKAFENRGEVVQ